MKSTTPLIFVMLMLLALIACAPQTDQSSADMSTMESGGAASEMTGGADATSTTDMEADVEPEGPNLISNSSFNNDEGWEAYFLASAEGESAFSYGEVCLNIRSGGSDIWNTQVLQGGLSLEPGESYTVSFNAYANKPVEVRAALEENGNDYTLLTSEMFALTNDRTDYTFSGEIPESVDEGRVSVSTGGEAVSATPVRICLDDLEVRASAE